MIKARASKNWILLGWYNDDKIYEFEVDVDCWRSLKRAYSRLASSISVNVIKHSGR